MARPSYENHVSIKNNFIFFCKLFYIDRSHITFKNNPQRDFDCYKIAMIS